MSNSVLVAQFCVLLLAQLLGFVCGGTSIVVFTVFVVNLVYFKRLLTALQQSALYVCSVNAENRGLFFAGSGVALIWTKKEVCMCLLDPSGVPVW